MKGKENHVGCAASHPRVEFLCVLILLVAMSTATAQTPLPEQLPPTIIYVDDDASGLNIGTSWANAINSLQDALLLAYFYDKPVEIRVAEGIYTPDKGVGITPGDRTASFQLINDVTIKGGYASLNRRGRLPHVRDINHLYESILSGDLNADDDRYFTNNSDNSYHVVTASGIDATAVLDGLTITGAGSIPEEPLPYASGMYNDESSPTLLNCTFGENATAESGGGMYNNSSNPLLLNCTFIRNRAMRGGGGMYNDNSSPTLTNCTFIENEGGGGGGGMHNVNSSPMLSDCAFSWNWTVGGGGGMYNESSDPALLNCTFSRNSSGREGGGGMNNVSSSNPTLTNCTFIENSGDYSGGGGMYNANSSPMLSDCAFSGNSTAGGGGGMYNDSSSPTLLSCIFSGNSAYRNGGGMYNRYRSQPSLTNCIFSGNSANYGGGMESLEASRPTLFNCTFSANSAAGEGRGGGISSLQNSITKLVNCILWADAPDEICTVSEVLRLNSLSTTSGTVEITYSNVQNDWPGEGNIDIDPLFADPDNGDYHLKSQAGRWEPNDGRWTMDDVTSPCIDAGDPCMPVGLERLPNGGRINMGAYGGTHEASLSSWPRLLSRASNPSPADGAIGVYYRNVKLSWTTGLNAVSHNVYFGPTIRDMFLVSMHQTATEFEFRTLELSYGTTYYWRIDEVDSVGAITSGEVWTFTTTTSPSRR